MSFATMLSAGFGLLLAGGLILPFSGMRLTTWASARLLFGMLALVSGGALIGRAMLA